MFRCFASSSLSRFRLWSVSTAAWLCMSASVVFAQGQAAESEYQKKAEYIGSFTRFVDWPARKFQHPDAPFVIGVYGMDSISGLLQEALQDRPIKGRPTVIKHLLNKEELRACHV